MNFKSKIFTCITCFVIFFLIAIISKVPLLISFVRALIISICFGALSFGISFVFDKFLKDDANSSVDENTKEQVSGSKIDITIGDEELSDEENSPRFTLTGSNQMLNRNDLAGGSNVSSDNGLNSGSATGWANLASTGASASSASGGAGVGSSANSSSNSSGLSASSAVGANLASTGASSSANAGAANATNANFAGASASGANVGSASVNSAVSGANSSTSGVSATENSQQETFKPLDLTKASSSSNATDAFPDIESSLGINSILNSSNEDELDAFPEVANGTSLDNAVTDSEFASAGKSGPRLSDTVFPDGELAQSKDTKLMAEAIKTVLKKEE